jgi:hypothetical protein
MTHRVGLWIDHQKAVIVSVSGQGETVKKIESGAKHFEFRGPTRTKVAYNAQYGKGDDQLDKQYQQKLGRYYAQVMAELRRASTVLVFGPGEAKSELKRLIQQDKGMRCELHLEPADRMTDRQIIARVRDFLASKPSGE